MAKDPYKYFRVEARELVEGLSQGVLQLDKGAPSPEVLSRLLRLAHTLKGAARVVKQPRIAELAHAMEGLLGQGEGASRHVAPLLQHLDEVVGALRSLDPTVERAPERPAQSAVEEPLETVRVDLQDMDALLRDVSEAGVQLGALRRSSGTIAELRGLAALLKEQLASRLGEEARALQLTRAQTTVEELRGALDRFQRSLGGDVERVERDLAEARDVAFRLRLLPARTVFPSLERAVHDAAESQGRRVRFEATGGDVRLDAGVLGALRDALMHVVRNAVAHGIENEEERAVAGKQPLGQVRLQAQRRGTRVAFRCTDDGRGINVEGIRSAAVKRGHVSPEKAATLTTDEVLRLAFAEGVTTRGEVTELSGRGIGLDVVRETVARLKGEVSLTTAPGQGTTVELVVPISLASFGGLIVEAGGAASAIPLDAVHRTLRVQDAEIARSAGAESILLDEQVVPFLPLEVALRKARFSGRRRSVWTTVVVRANTGLAALGVERIIGTSSIVMRAVPSVAEADAVVAGVCIDPEGNPQLVLDPAGLVACVLSGRDEETETATPARPPVLVVDDSLTTRMLEKSILESAGWTVDLATSAEEALVRARERSYGLFIVDVEMPGMDGFEFVTRTRADATLRTVPAILVTSRNAPEDRRRGIEAGASAYIVKSEFDQGHLLQTIRTLVG